MAKKKAARDKIMATKTDEKGLIIVHTGKGKGKSSAAFGMIFRAIAHGMPSAVVQFIKGGMKTGERDLIESRFADLCQFHTMGEGFTWETQDKTRDIEMARAAWEKSKELIRDPGIRMVLLDEINIALRYDYLDLAEVVGVPAQTEKPEMTHVILTGRNAARRADRDRRPGDRDGAGEAPVPRRREGAGGGRVLARTTDPEEPPDGGRSTIHGEGAPEGDPRNRARIGAPPARPTPRRARRGSSEVPDHRDRG